MVRSTDFTVIHTTVLQCTIEPPKMPSTPESGCLIYLCACLAGCHSGARVDFSCTLIRRNKHVGSVGGFEKGGEKWAN